MTFEKALEAMKQGKKVRRKSWIGGELDNIFLSETNLFTLMCDDIFADDWEIYQEEQEMTAEFAVKLLDEIKYTTVEHESEFEKIFAYFNVSDATKALDFAIKALENQNQSEKKCECKCGQETINNDDLQEEMKQALSRKFFELGKIEIDEYNLSSSNILTTVGYMNDIYKILFER